MKLRIKPRLRTTRSKVLIFIRRLAVIQESATITGQSLFLRVTTNIEGVKHVPCQLLLKLTTNLHQTFDPTTTTTNTISPTISQLQFTTLPTNWASLLALKLYHQSRDLTLYQHFYKQGYACRILGPSPPLLPLVPRLPRLPWLPLLALLPAGFHRMDAEDAADQDIIMSDIRGPQRQAQMHRPVAAENPRHERNHAAEQTPSRHQPSQPGQTYNSSSRETPYLDTSSIGYRIVSY